MTIRQAYRAGSFYQADPNRCRQEAMQLVQQAALPADLPKVLYGGLVPHAGWAFSGATAAMTLKALAAAGRLERVVIFGADHFVRAAGASLFDKGSWQTPLGPVAIDQELADQLLSHCPLLHTAAAAHAREHSIEVQLPLMLVLSPGAKIVPINISPDANAAETGRQVGRLLREKFPQAGVIGSTDLTHYGPQYDFTPAGIGPDGLKWAQENDRRVLDLIEKMQAEKIVAETNEHWNACGGGAVAATVAACAELGATAGITLQYTNSAEVMRRVYHSPADDAVGYASVVFI